MKDELVSIGEVAARTGLATSAIRYYEDRALVRPVTRVSGRRRFSPDVVQRLAVIDLLRAAGFTLAEMQQILAGGRRSWRARAERKLAEVEDRIERASAARRILQAALECDCDRLEGCEVAVRHGQDIARHRV